MLEQEPERIEQLWTNTRYFKQGLKEAGFNTGISETPITPVIVGEAKLAYEFSQGLFEEGVFATGIAIALMKLASLGASGRSAFSTLLILAPIFSA